MTRKLESKLEINILILSNGMPEQSSTVFKGIQKIAAPKNIKSKISRTQSKITRHVKVAIHAHNEGKIINQKK